MIYNAWEKKRKFGSICSDLCTFVVDSSGWRQNTVLSRVLQKVTDFLRSFDDQFNLHRLMYNYNYVRSTQYINLSREYFFEFFFARVLTLWAFGLRGLVQARVYAMPCDFSVGALNIGRPPTALAGYGLWSAPRIAEPQVLVCGERRSHVAVISCRRSVTQQ
jgi:hypothetical protein